VRSMSAIASPIFLPIPSMWRCVNDLLSGGSVAWHVSGWSSTFTPLRPKWLPLRSKESKVEFISNIDPKIDPNEAPILPSMLITRERFLRTQLFDIFSHTISTPSLSNNPFNLRKFNAGSRFWQSNWTAFSQLMIVGLYCQFLQALACIDSIYELMAMLFICFIISIHFSLKAEAKLLRLQFIELQCVTNAAYKSAENFHFDFSFEWMCRKKCSQWVYETAIPPQCLSTRSHLASTPSFPEGVENFLG